MAIKNVTKTIFTALSFNGTGLKDSTGLGVREGVLYVSEDYLKANRTSVTIRGSRGSTVTVAALDGAEFGALTLTQLAVTTGNGEVGFKVSGSTSIEDEGVFQIDALFAVDDGVSGAKVSSSDITDATTAGRTILTAADVAAVKQFLAIAGADLADAGSVGKEVIKASTGSAAMTALKMTTTFSAIALTNAPTAAQKTAFLNLIGAQPAAS